MDDNKEKSIVDYLHECVEEIMIEVREGNVDPNDTCERVWEYVDGSQYTIYTCYHEAVLSVCSEYRTNAAEVRAMCADDASWGQMRQADAFLAMQGRLQAMVEEAIAEEGL